jgi:DNA/RNA endonuclease YhcR with UshA esterase domain
MGRKYEMRDFTWNYFSMTGNVGAYLFYKEMVSDETEDDASNPDSMDIEEDELMGTVNS